MKTTDQPNPVSEGDAFQELTSIQPAADRLRFAAVRHATALSLARKKSLLRQEKAMVTRHGPTSPEAAQARRRLVAEEQFLDAARAEEQRGSIEPVRRDSAALTIVGRVVDSRRLGLARLTVSAMDSSGKPSATALSTNAGHFVLRVAVRDPEAPERVTLLVSDSERRVLYRSCASFPLRAGGVVVREILVPSVEPTTPPTPPPDIDPERITVPDVRGLPEREAGLRLSALCLQPRVVDQETSRDKVGLVLSQDPRPGANLPRAAEVVLGIGRAARTTAVPDVRKHVLKEARELLRKAQLKVGAVDPANAADEAVVLEQDPAADTQVALDSEVHLKVRIPGEQPASVEVPDLAERSLTEAKRLLKSAQLTLGNVEPTGAPASSRVLRQKPRAGSRVGLGSAVDLEVSGNTGDNLPTVTARPEGPSKKARASKGKKAGAAGAQRSAQAEVGRKRRER